MKIFTNEPQARRIRRSRSITVLATTTVLLMLTFTVVLTSVARFLPQLANSPVILIAMGIASSLVGLRAGKLLSARTPVSETLAQGLKGFGDDSVLLHYYAPSHHLLLSPTGIFSLTPIQQPADILADGSSLRIQNSFWTRFAWFLTGNLVGTPYSDAQDSALRTMEWLQNITQSPEPIVVEPLLVLTHPKSHLQTNTSSIPILYLDKRTPSLKQYVRRSQSAALSPTILNQLLNSLTPPPHHND